MFEQAFCCILVLLAMLQRKPRLRSSAMDFRSMRGAIFQWIAKLGHKRVLDHLDAVVSTWSWKAMPLEDVLVTLAFVSLVNSFLEHGCADLNPTLVLLCDAFLSINNEATCLFSADVWGEARQIAGNVRVLFNKYRTIREYPENCPLHVARLRYT